MNDSTAPPDFAGQPLSKRLWGYFRLTGPGYMQSAMTLGGGSVASCAVMGSLLGYELLWVQPLGMFLGYVLLASIAKQTTHTQQRTYSVFWSRLHPALAILWALSAFVATIIWHIPQYSLTANGIVTLGEGAGLNLGSTAARAAIGAVVLALAVWIVYLYNSGAKGLKSYEVSVKILVWLIVFAFAIVVIATGVDWARLLTGITGIAFLQNVFDADGLAPQAIPPIVGGIAAAVGINMVFLYPYSLLNKNWGPKQKELAYFDLLSGMALPFILATGLMILAVANTIGPAPGETAESSVRDIREIIPVLGPTLANLAGGEDQGTAAARLIIGLGITAIGFSTIITHMLACGFIGCEMFGKTGDPKMRWIFSLVPAVGVAGVVYPFPLPLAITASTLAAPLMPVAAICFLILLNNKDYMGAERPGGAMRFTWNILLCVAILVMTVNAYFALTSNWRNLNQWLQPEEPAAATAMPATESPQPETSPQDRPNIVSQPDETDRLFATFSHPAMATEFEIFMYGRPGDTHPAVLRRIADEAFAAIDDLENRISSWRDHTQVAYINRHAAAGPVKASAEVIQLIADARQVWEQTGGAFDITVGPLIDLWRPHAAENTTPAPEAIEQALARVGMDRVTLDRAELTVEFATEGMRLDFGGIGKGMALDRAAETLEFHGIANALLSAGSSTIIALGSPPGKPYWTVHVRNPYNEQRHIDTLPLTDASFSTSACYGSPGDAGGGTPCHIIDPRTGQPVQGVLSVSAIAPNATLSDALSTAFLVMGKQQIETYCREHPNIGAVFVAMPEYDTPLPERINIEREPS